MALLVGMRLYLGSSGVPRRTQKSEWGEEGRRLLEGDAKT